MVKLSLNPDSDTLQFDESRDSYDSFWLKKVLSKVKKLHSGEEFKELIKVVKMISIMPNSQGFVERGFNATKLIADSRQNVSESLMTSSKVLLDHMRHVGGPSKVLISRDLLVAHKSAYQTYQTRLMKEKHEKELEARNKLKEIEAQNKKRKFEEESLQWENKVKSLKNDIKVLQEAYSNNEKIIRLLWIMLLSIQISLKRMLLSNQQC